MPRRLKTKRKTRSVLHQHFHKRLIERYGATTNRREVMKAIEQIQGGTSVLVGKVSNRVSNHVVVMNVTRVETMEQKQISVVVGYDSIRKALVTALPSSVSEDSDQITTQTSPQI